MDFNNESYSYNYLWLVWCGVYLAHGMVRERAVKVFIHNTQQYQGSSSTTGVEGMEKRGKVA